jgi:hypothetical protein
VFANATNQYSITGDSLTVGSGGIADTGGGGTGDVVHAPIALSVGPQTWTVGSTVKNGYNSLTLLGGITDIAAVALTASTPRGDLFVDSDMEVGPVTSNGPGGFHIGGPPGSGNPGSVNGTDGQSVTINGGSLVANPNSTTGPLTINGGTLLLGTNPQNNGATTLHVNGAARLGSSITTTTFINDNGSTPGTDFSQVSASGNITLGGQLSVNQGPSTGTCVKLSPGDVATLFTTTGTLSGTFTGVPNGQVITMASSCQSTAPQLQIHYTSNSVTATVVSATTTPTTTLTTPNPSPKLPPPPPAISATTSPATRVGTTQATLNGSLDTGGATVTWKFEYGRRTTYNQATPLQTIAAGQHGTVSLSSVVKRLSPTVRYHYRLVVFSQASTSAAAQGNDLTFKTRATGRLLGPAGRLSVFGRTILVPERCQSSVRCTGRFLLTTTVRVGKHRKLATLVCATGGFRIRAHRVATARVRPSAACSRLLRAQPHHRLVVTYTAQSNTGQLGLRRRITLVLR